MAGHGGVDLPPARAAENSSRSRRPLAQTRTTLRQVGGAEGVYPTASNIHPERRASIGREQTLSTVPLPRAPGSSRGSLLRDLNHSLPGPTVAREYILSGRLELNHQAAAADGVGLRTGGHSAEVPVLPVGQAIHISLRQTRAHGDDRGARQKIRLSVTRRCTMLVSPSIGTPFTE